MNSDIDFKEKSDLSEHFLTIEKCGWIFNFCLCLLFLFPSSQIEILGITINNTNSCLLRTIFLVIVLGLQLALTIEWHHLGMPDSIFSFLFRYTSLCVVTIVNLILVFPSIINTQALGIEINRIFMLFAIILGFLLGLLGFSPIILASANIITKEKASRFLCPRYPFLCKFKFIQGLVVITIFAWISLYSYYHISVLLFSVYLFCSLFFAILGIAKGCSYKERKIFKKMTHLVEETCYLKYAEKKSRPYLESDSMANTDKYVKKIHEDTISQLYDGWTISVVEKINFKQMKKNASKSNNQKDFFTVLVQDNEIKQEIISIKIPYKIYEQAYQYRPRHEKSRENLTIKSIAIAIILKETIKSYTNEQFEKMVFLLAQAGEEFILEEIFKTRHINVNFQLQYGWTPLLIASAQNHLGTVKLLLEKGADPNIKNMMQCNALLMAAHHGFIEIVKILIEYGAKLNEQDSQGRTVLDVSVERGNKDLVLLLLRKKVNVSEKCIQMCYKNGHGDIAKILLKAKYQNVRETTNEHHPLQHMHD